MSTNLQPAPFLIPLAAGTRVTLTKAIEGKYTYEDRVETKTLQPRTQVIIGTPKELTPTRVSTGLPGGAPIGFVYMLQVELPEKIWWTALPVEPIIGGRNRTIPHRLLSTSPTSKRTDTSPAILGEYLSDRFFMTDEFAYVRGDHTYLAGRNGKGPNSTNTLRLGDRVYISTDPVTNGSSTKIVSEAPTEKELREATYGFRVTRRGEEHIPVWTSKIYCFEDVDFTVNGQ